LATSSSARFGAVSPIYLVYAHLFDRNDGDVAKAVDKLFKAAD
jgi:hypothetical protein